MNDDTHEPSLDKVADILIGAEREAAATRIDTELSALAGRTVWMLDRPRCPECGSTLNTDGRRVWCSFVGDRDIKGCTYGLATPVGYHEITSPDTP